MKKEKTLTELRALIEKQLRIEFLGEWASKLRRELTAVESELAGLTKARPKRAKIVEKVKQGKKRRIRRGPGAGPSVRELAIAFLKKQKRPMTVSEITKGLLRLGYKTSRPDPRLTVDATLRRLPKVFRKVGPSTFELA